MSEIVKTKRELGSALTDSMNAEKQSIDARFRRADVLFQEKESPQVNNKPVDESASINANKAPERVKKTMPSKHKPEKVIRDTFTMPPYDYRRIAEIQQEGLQSAIQVNKSEVIRAGLIVLQALPEKKRLEMLQSIEKLKPGRPTT